jgi:hypothetical protein
MRPPKLSHIPTRSNRIRHRKFDAGAIPAQFYFFVTAFHAPAIAKAVRNPRNVNRATSEASTWTNG